MDSAPPISKVRWFVRALIPLGGFLIAGLIVGWPLGQLMRSATRSNDQTGAGRYFLEARMDYEKDHPEGLPPEALADIYAYALYFARAKVLGESSFWFSLIDPLAGTPPTYMLNITQDSQNAAVNPGFQGAPLAWAIMLRPTIRDLPGNMPWLWTRGLQPDGT
jgi:hypothetical protein